MPILVTITH